MAGPKDTSRSLWDPEQRKNANTIITVGVNMGVSWRDIQTALAVAMQESSLRNLDYGDADSLGLFQQRPSMGWGTPQQVQDPVYASRKFYQALKQVKGRDQMPLTEAAQAVQRSAYPDAYAKWADAAHALVQDARQSGVKIVGNPASMPVDHSSPLDFLAAPIATDSGSPVVAQSALGATTAPSTGAPGLGASTAGYTVNLPAFTPQQYAEQMGGPYGQKGIDQTRRGLVEFAKQYVGTPYVWGGNSLTQGVDCSGLVQQVFQHFGVELPRVAYQQANYGTRAPLNKLRPGDLVAWDENPRSNGAEHIAIYAGHGKIIEAPKPGLSVRVRKLGPDEGAYGVRLDY